MPVLDHCVIIVGTSVGGEEGKACLFLSFAWFFGNLIQSKTNQNENHDKFIGMLLFRVKGGVNACFRSLCNYCWY